MRIILAMFVMLSAQAAAVANDYNRHHSRDNWYYSHHGDHINRYDVYRYGSPETGGYRGGYYGGRYHDDTYYDD